MSTEFVYARKDVLVDIQNVTFQWNGGTPILREVSAQIRDVVRPGIHQGQIVGLLGPSGVGKTTLFKILAGLLKPTVGAVKIGADARPAAPGLVGVVAQNYILFDHRSVIGNLVIAGKQGGLTGDEAQKKAMEYLEHFRLTEHAEKYPIQLSGGQRQRVAIAQQLLCSEHFLVMDEPFSGLDVIAQEAVEDLLLDVSRRHEHTTLIVVTHDVAAAVAIADTIWLMGRDRDPQGNVIPGARIVEQIDLIERGLAWQPDIRHRPEYATLVNEIKERFYTL